MKNSLPKCDRKGYSLLEVGRVENFRVSGRVESGQTIVGSSRVKLFRAKKISGRVRPEFLYSGRNGSNYKLSKFD